jgi:hypothetical protein
MIYGIPVAGDLTHIGVVERANSSNSTNPTSSNLIDEPAKPGELPMGEA